jgi:hypothetical protein
MYALLPQGYMIRLKTKLVPDFSLLFYKINGDKRKFETSVIN